MTHAEYLELTMKKISNIIYNGQNFSIQKEDILKSLKNMLEEYNNLTNKNIT